MVEAILATLGRLLDTMLISFFLFLFSRILHAIHDMRQLAKKSWQKALTEAITAFLGLIAIGAIIVLYPILL